LLQFTKRDVEGGAFDDVGRVAGKLEVAMIGRAAGRDELLVVDANDLYTITAESVFRSL